NPAVILTSLDSPSQKADSIKNNETANLASSKTHFTLSQTRGNTPIASPHARSDSGIKTDRFDSSPSSFSSTTVRSEIVPIPNLSVGCKLYVEVIRGKFERDKKEFRKAEILAI
ncbi:14213_t:CDS:1, partial [Acaulospora colombiana]